MYENETYDVILERILNRIPDTLDKRNSSFLYTASAPIAVELQNIYLALDNILNITFFDTSDREGKLQRCKERGIDITQFDATAAIVVIDTTPASLDIQIQSRFNYNEINYVITEKIEDGSYYATCETPGTVGNITGEVTPIDYITGLTSAEISSIYQWGEDEASETQINDIYYASLASQAFGGNRADYIEKTKKISGVGGVKVYSGEEWNGGGTVKLVFTTSAYTKPSNSFVASVQTLIDPIQNAGEGYGIAPIGHTVTVAGVDETTINIAFTVTLQTGYTWDDVKDYVNTAIDNYFTALSEDWDSEANIIVRISQVEIRLLSVTGIVDVTALKLNGAATNVSLDADNIPKRGSVNATT